MDKIIKDLERKIGELKLSDDERLTLTEIINKLEKKSRNEKLKLDLTLKNATHTRNTLDEMISEVEFKKNEISKINADLLMYQSELLSINKKLSTANDTIKSKNRTIEENHRNIVDSINYAKRIQSALLTNKEFLRTSFVNDYFLIYIPKATVSGDFYYLNQIKDKKILVVGDCTGHGVPGALLTMLGITYLHEIIKNNWSDSLDAATVLNFLRNQFKGTFMDFGAETKEGIDMVICLVNTKTGVLQFSGANNPLWIIRNNEIHELKATKNPIGFHPKETEFVSRDINLKDGDLVYLFSDGFQDQFGGENGKKYTRARYRRFLLQICHLPIDQQKDRLKKELNDWKRDGEQTDDITVLGWQYNQPKTS